MIVTPEEAGSVVDAALADLSGPARPHPEYRKWWRSWRRCRDVAAGEEAVKARGDEYLPPLHSNREGYKGYLTRAPFYGATGRTIEGLVGLAFRADPEFRDVPEGMEDHFSSIDLRGQTLQWMAVAALRNFLKVGRFGLALDAADGRPYWTLYRAEDVLSWLIRTPRGDVPYVARVVLRERYYEESDDDKWDVQSVEVLRVIEKTPTGVTSTFYRKSKKTDEWVAGDAKVLVMAGGAPLDRVPVWLCNITGTDEVGKPPLLDLVDMNLSHYRTSADLEQGAHWSALPTPWVSSPDSLPEDFALGSGHILEIGMDSAAGMLEITGSGLMQLSDIENRKANQMATLGARLIADPLQEAETAEAVRIKAAGDGSLLSIAVTLVQSVFTAALRFHAEWNGTPADTAEMVFNREWFAGRLKPEEVREMMGLVQANHITPSEFVRALRSGEWLPQREPKGV